MRGYRSGDKGLPIDDFAEKVRETAWTDYPIRNHEKRNCSVNVNRDMDIILATW